MTLHGEIRVNGRVIGRWWAHRLRTGRYRWAYHADGFEAHGVLTHRADDGPSTLAARVLAAACAPARR